VVTCSALVHVGYIFHPISCNRTEEEHESEVQRLREIRSNRMEEERELELQRLREMRRDRSE